MCKFGPNLLDITICIFNMTLEVNLPVYLVEEQYMVFILILN